MNNQNWFQYNEGDGSWSYYVKYRDGLGIDTGHYCLDAPQGQNWDGDKVQMYACPDAGEATNVQQHWTIGPAGQLQSVADAGKCLDDTDWATTDGTLMQLWDCAY
jgi:hypothetical protein